MARRLAVLLVAAILAVCAAGDPIAEPASTSKYKKQGQVRILRMHSRATLLEVAGYSPCPGSISQISMLTVDPSSSERNMKDILYGLA